jgi:hypothetical protein
MVLDNSKMTTPSSNPPTSARRIRFADDPVKFYSKPSAKFTPKSSDEPTSGMDVTMIAASQQLLSQLQLQSQRESLWSYFGKEYPMCIYYGTDVDGTGGIFPKLEKSCELEF